jgi:DNA-binding transcriptional LysR family regulator
VFIVAQFLAFARAGSMQAAAKAPRVHQSTMQRRIAELEESFGRSLVEPHRGGYRLTEELQSTQG